MKGSTHFSIGTAAGAVIGTIFYEETGNLAGACAILAGGAFGGLFPDIDVPTSSIGNKIPVIPTLLNKVFGHRGFIHSPLLMVIICVLLHVCLPSWDPFTIGFAAGFITHILLDMCNPAGIPLLYPWKKRFHILKIHASSPIQTPIAVVGWVVVIVLAARIGIVLIL